LVAADELEARSNFGFMAPILRAWVSVAKTGTHDLTLKEGNTDSFFNFYAVDQIVYLDLATDQNGKAKLGLRNMVSVGGYAMRDLFISAAPVLAHKGDAAFANAMLGAVMGSDFAGQLNGYGAPKSNISPNIGLAALYVRIATSLIEQDVPEPGLALARLALWTAPEYPPAAITTAHALGKLSGSRDAVALLDKIPSASPYWTRTVFAKAALLRDMGDNDGAVQLARLSYDQNANSAARATFLGQMLQQNGRLPEAIAQYGIAMELDDFKRQAPQSRASFHLMFASALDENGQWDEAQRELRNAIVLDPSNAGALNYLGYSMLERGEDVVNAEAFVRRAYEAEPTSSAYADSLGWALFQNGKYIDAVTILEKAASIEDADATIFEHLGDAYWRSGRRRDARHAWNSAAISADSPEARASPSGPPSEANMALSPSTAVPSTVFMIRPPTTRATMAMVRRPIHASGRARTSAPARVMASPASQSSTAMAAGMRGRAATTTMARMAPRSPPPMALCGSSALRPKETDAAPARACWR
jgi:tetratricopeptide (TPR) repeat protein